MTVAIIKEAITNVSIFSSENHNIRETYVNNGPNARCFKFHRCDLDRLDRYVYEQLNRQNQTK